MPTTRWYDKYIVDAGRKDLKANLAFRRQLRVDASKSGAMRSSLMKACAEDILFWFNAFCFVFEPRPRYDANGHKLPKTIPFITWPHQDPIIKALEEYLGRRDIGINKSRGEGLSWIAVLKALHECLFDPDGSNIGLVSSKLEKADKTGAVDTALLPKVIWELEHLPPWMSGRRAKDATTPGDWHYNSTDHAIHFRKNNAIITAFAATGGTGRGGRYTWFVADELGEWEEGPAAALMDSTGPATDSRLIISTPAGPMGTYYRFIHTPSNAKILKSHWSENIAKNRGLYTWVRGKPCAVDPKNNPLPVTYDPPNQDVMDMFSRLRHKGFDLKSGLRSPWYDNECDRGDVSPVSIAKELDLDFGGSVDKVFHHEFFEVVEKTIRPAQIRGQFYASPEDSEWDFEKSSDGHFHLWCELDHKNQPPKGDYAVACDVAAGGGGAFSSNSTIEVIDLITHEQVMEYAINTVKPEDFADIAIGVCHWFHGAYLAWEHQGPGTAFGTRVHARRYGNVFDRKVPWKSTATKIVREPGWITTTESKEALFEGLRAAVKRRELIIHSRDLVTELHQYIRNATGKIEHAALASATGNEAGAAHGDRVIAIGIAVQAAVDRPQAVRRREDWTPDGSPARGTLAWREWLAKELEETSADDWDDRSTYDLTQPGANRAWTPSKSYI